MGTEIDLRVGGLMLDWSKNSRGADHGMLFQEVDRRLLPSEPIEGEDEDAGIHPAVSDHALSRCLGSTVRRLELLGYTLDVVEAEYQRRVDEWNEYNEDMAEEGISAKQQALTFGEFVEFVAKYPLAKLDTTYVTGFDAESRQRIERRFSGEEAVARIPNTEHDGNAYSEMRYFGTLIGFLHPYSLMRVLALCPENLDAELLWHYGPMVDSGWATEDEFAPSARRTQTFLIATEGSSDAHILKRAFTLLLPEVEDFFRFIDVSERHPFPGTGNLLKFAEGLAKIDVQNQVVFLFDNDAEGFEAFCALQSFKLPPNMRGMVLPKLEEFREFPARGPQGTSKADINRRAAAIECYLDLRAKGRPPAQVVWTNYKKDQDVYHGSLVYKESYIKRFMKQTRESVISGQYDFTKLQSVLDGLVQACSAMAEQAHANHDGVQKHP